MDSIHSALNNLEQKKHKVRNSLQHNHYVSPRILCVPAFSCVGFLTEGEDGRPEKSQMGMPQDEWFIRENPNKVRMMTGCSPILGNPK